MLRALARAPDSPEAASAWFHVVIASDRLGDFAGERDAYTESLRFEWDRRARADAYANRGEASMSHGDRWAENAAHQLAWCEHRLEKR